MTVRHKGIEYTNLITGQLDTSIGSVCGGFSFTTSADQSQRLPIKCGDEIQILIDGTPKLTGFADSIDGSYSGSEHNITVSGRDKTQDLVDSTPKGKKEFNSGISLVSIIQSLLSDLGATSIKIKNEAGAIPSFTEVTSAEIGQTIFQFIESYSRKKQVLLTTDGLGNIVLARGATTPSGIILLNKINDVQNLNNILSSNFRVSVEDRFKTYVVQAQKSPLFGLQAETAERLSGIIGRATDNDIRSTRHLEFFGEESMTDDETKNRAKWEANLRRARSLSYTATVQGHSINGRPWSFNQIVKVQDDFWDIAADLLLADVSYMYSASSGSTTNLTMTYPDAFTLEANLEAIKRRTQKIGPALFSPDLS